MEIVRDLSEELKSSYIDYAMSVIIGRALPDVRDGLKPVQRRILYSMFEMGLLSDKPYKKSARVVGEVLGKYHPHGDQAVYDALVRMTQDFNMRYPLIDGQGNFGSIDGDEPAAMRYTEVRLTKIAEEMLADIDKDTVDFIPNFDATLKEPSVLPSRIPNLLINGSSGIAVGMTTNIPPHNLREVCDAIIAYINDEDIEIENLMEYIKGPDFPTGGIIVGVDGIKEAYKTGRGKITVRGRAVVEDRTIIIREIPYQVNKANLVEKIADLIREGKIENVKAVRDESDREGIRIVLELRPNANPDVILKKLYKFTPLQTTFGVINLALVDGEPRVLNLKELIAEFVKHRREVIRRRISYELKKSEERLHIVKGLKIAVENIDETISLIKESENASIAKEKLKKRFNLDDQQVDAILQMRLQKLTTLEIESLIREFKVLEKRIQELKEILDSRRRIDEIIIKELEELREKYGDERRTTILEENDEILEEDLIVEEENLLIITESGHVKRLDINAFRTQARGGVGVIGTILKNDDKISCLSLVKSTDRLLLFSNKGRCYWMYAYEIPKLDRTSKGENIRKLIHLNEKEFIVSVVPFNERDLIVLTKNGFIKRIKSSEFENAKRAGIMASPDEILLVKPVEGKDVIISTKRGMLLRFDVDEVPLYGRTARGVKAIKLRENDEIAWMDCGSGNEIVILTENGYGKRCLVENFRKISRGSQGMICMKTDKKRGGVNFSEFVKAERLFAISKDGQAIMVGIDQISLQGRNTGGVIVSRSGIHKAVQVLS